MPTPKPEKTTPTPNLELDPEPDPEPDPTMEEVNHYLWWANLPKEVHPHLAPKYRELAEIGDELYRRLVAEGYLTPEETSSTPFSLPPSS